jgi:hypothetical protein
LSETAAAERERSLVDWLEAHSTALAVWLAALTFLLGAAIGLDRLAIEPWQDEFNTIATTLPQFTLHDFLEHSRRGQHPFLYEGLVYLGQHAGLTDPNALRLINLVGIPLAIGSVWLSWRMGMITTAQAAVVVALYASSANFVIYLASIRPYFLMFSAAIAVAMSWRLVWRDAPGAIWAWAITLAIFVNLHYFATILGGVATAALLIYRARHGRWRDVFALAAVSGLAAAPALFAGVTQAPYTTHSGVLYYYPGGLLHGLTMIYGATLDGIAVNLPAVLFGAVGAFYIAKHPPERGEWHDVIAFAAVVGVYFALTLTLHLIKPMLYERYFTGAAGFILVIVALCAAGAHAPRLAPLAICAFAALVCVYSYLYGPVQPGWAKTADAIQKTIAACPSTKVYSVPYARISNGPIWTTPLNPTEIEARRYGYDFYARRRGFTYQELKPGDTIVPDRACPTLIWIEHFYPFDGMGLLYNLKLRGEHVAYYEQLGSGVLIHMEAPQ